MAWRKENSVILITTPLWLDCLPAFHRDSRTTTGTQLLQFTSSLYLSSFPKFYPLRHDPLPQAVTQTQKKSEGGKGYWTLQLLLQKEIKKKNFLSSKPTGWHQGCDLEELCDVFVSFPIIFLVKACSVLLCRIKSLSFNLSHFFTDPMPHLCPSAFTERHISSVYIPFVTLNLKHDSAIWIHGQKREEIVIFLLRISFCCSSLSLPTSRYFGEWRLLFQLQKSYSSKFILQNTRLHGTNS